MHILTTGFRLLVATIICGFSNIQNANAAPIQTVRLAAGLDRPVFLTAPANDNSRLFIVEQHSGQIKIMNRVSGSVRATPFLSVPGINLGDEQGLLGLAFHPNYSVNRKFYVNFTTENETRIVEYQTSTDPNLADTTSAKTIMTYQQPFSNHNGGWLGFGKDEYLYIASGDGGSGNDPGNRAQDTTEQKLGKILRVDINRDDFIGAVDPTGVKNYGIPASNPFVGTSGDAEIWAFGLRNPWRPSFDRDTGDLYIADVGQDMREEINFQLASSAGGENYGWRLREGKIETPDDVGGLLPIDAVDPIFDYPHENTPDGGFSITGGYIYRGPISELKGKYFFADFVSKQIWSIEHDGENVTLLENWTDIFSPDVGTIDAIASFGQDLEGNLYILDLGGEIFTLKAIPLPASALY